MSMADFRVTRAVNARPETLIARQANKHMTVDSAPQERASFGPPPGVVGSPIVSVV